MSDSLNGDIVHKMSLSLLYRVEFSTFDILQDEEVSSVCCHLTGLLSTKARFILSALLSYCKCRYVDSHCTVFVQ